MGLRPTKLNANGVASRLAGSRRLLSRCMRPFAGAFQQGARDFIQWVGIAYFLFCDFPVALRSSSAATSGRTEL